MRIGGGTGREDEGACGMLELATLMIRGLLSRFAPQRELMFMAQIRKSDLAYIATLIEERKVTPVIERTYPLADAAEAIRQLEGGHARGKVILTVT